MSISRVPGLAGVADREHEHGVVCGPPPIERQISFSTLGDDELATAIFHRTPKQRMTFQNHDGLANLLNRAQRPSRICFRCEFEDALEVSERSRAQLDCRHAFGRGRLARSPRARDSR